jgi:phage terminase large subunit
VTTTTTAEVERRRRPAAEVPDRLLTFDDLAAELGQRVAQHERLRFPSPRYRNDPAAFAREILGLELWAKQLEILELVRDHKRVAVKSGHRVGKSYLIAAIALWFYCSFEDARVVLSSTTSRQVDAILWRAVKMLRAKSGRCVSCKKEDPDGKTIPTPCPHSTLIDGDLGELARTGLKSKSGFREIVGYTARESEAIAGIAGTQLLFMIDEASGVPDFIYHAMTGNRAGGAKLVLLGNPTRNSGEFFEAFFKKAEFYQTVTVSSEESPNVVAGRTVIPGLAEVDWIDEMQREWGVDSAFYKVRVKGEHAQNEEGKVFSLHRIAAGRLYIGLDPAGPSGSGDETVFAVRRGLKLLELIALRGLNEEGHVVHLLSTISKYKLPRELPVVVMDREGSVGAAVYGMLRSHEESTRGAAYELVGLRASDRAHRQPMIYDRLRDELGGNLERWFREGGAILEDSRLQKELHELEWVQAQKGGRMKLTPKPVIRKNLGRSPDRFDALALAAWEPTSITNGARDEEDEEDREEEDGGRALDPYAAGRTWRR